MSEEKTSQNFKAIIVGGGLAGLCAAKYLHEHNRSFELYECSERLGGRIATDQVEGFSLDRGFQILLEAYPEAQCVLNYHELALQRFDSGAIIYDAGKKMLVSDPKRHPKDFVPTLFSSSMTTRDKFKLLKLRKWVGSQSGIDLLNEKDIATHVFLHEWGFSERAIQHFFFPFFGGVFLDEALETSARMFLYVFKMFTEGRVSIPQQGMGAIPEQIAEALPSEAIHLNAAVEQVDKHSVTLASGEQVAASAVILATDLPAAVHLGYQDGERESRMTTCLYFDAPKAFIDRPMLMLNGSGEGVINTLHVVSAVNPHAAPSGRALISVSVLKDVPQVEDRVREELEREFGGEIKSWRLLKSYRIPQALPAQNPGDLEPPERPVKNEQGLFICGDHLDQSSIQGAMVSGRRAAEAVIAAC